jgi:hypothetical protein
VALVVTACAHRPDFSPSLDGDAESYVRLVLALGERDPDSLDSYDGPPEWAADARAKHESLDDLQRSASTLLTRLSDETLADRGKVSRPGNPDEIRKAFLVRQLHSLVARIDIVRGQRPAFADEARALFGIDVTPVDRERFAPVRARLDRLLPGHGDLASRYGAFEKRFVVPRDRVPMVLARAIDGCRAASVARQSLPDGEHVEIEYVHDMPWIAFTRYLGHFRSRIRVNADLALTADRALELACHESYPGHHFISSLIEAHATHRVELSVQPLFSPQSLLHEAAASFGSSLIFSESERLAFERDQIFPLAGLDSKDAERYLQVARLFDELHGVEADIARRYLDGELDFARAADRFRQEALMPSADNTLKFLNEYRTYAVTYTLGPDLVARFIDAQAGPDDRIRRWRAYLDLVTSPAQVIPGTK